MQALRGVSLSLQEGEIRAICGENGAGKSTLVKLLMGIHAPDKGTIELDGVEHSIRKPQQAQRLGFALVAQELSLVPYLSVLDNIWLGDARVPFFHRRAAFRKKAAEALETLGVDMDLESPVGELSIGQRQIVEIARLITRDARILILDEPTATLSDVEIERIFNVLRTLRSRGCSILYVTHRLGEVLQICDFVTVMRNGAHIATHRVADIDRHELIELMLGRSFDDMYLKPEDAPPSYGAMVVRELSIPGVLEPISFVAPRGKILSIAGQIGSGATELARAVAGLVLEATGGVYVDGRRLSLGDPYASRQAGINFVSEDRAGEGLFHRSVMENMMATRIPDFVRWGMLSWSDLKREAARLAARVNVDHRRLSADVFDLSGGNQQKVLFGRATGSVPCVLIMNEPTRGVDVGARADLYGLMHQFCREGYCVVMTLSDLEEIVGVSDIVLTLYRGRLVGRYERGEINITGLLSDIIHPTTRGEMAA